jgi:hypothetical protein
MQRCANEMVENTPVGGSSTYLATPSVLVSLVSVLGLEALTLFGLLLISPGCGPPT